MSRFNATVAAPKTRTTNLAGGVAYQQNAKLELASILLTSFVQDQYYRSANDTLKRFVELIDQIPDKKFIAKAAIFARNEFGMRSITHVAAAELAARVKGETWTRRFYRDVIFRPDDALETVAYFFNKYGKTTVNAKGRTVKRPLPNSLKDGIAEALAKFDAYQISKYKGEGKAYSMIDVVNLVRPKATPALTALINGNLAPAETWEAKLTQAGQAAKNTDELSELKADAWESLIREKKIGYFALVRNLRNILKDAPGVVDEAISILLDPYRIKNSKLFPYNYYVAAKELQASGLPAAGKVIAALGKAVDISMSNIPDLPGDTLVVCDFSDSMTHKLSDKGTITMKEVGSLFGVTLAKTIGADFMIFGSKAKYVPINPDNPSVTTVEWLQGVNRGGHTYGFKTTDPYRVEHGTNFASIFETVTKRYDRIFIFSDMQGWQGDLRRAFDRYKNLYAANPHLYTIDLAGHGTSQFPADQVYAIAGFSDKIFDMINHLETDKSALIRRIEDVEL